MKFYTLDSKKNNFNTSSINFSRWVKDSSFDRVKLLRGTSNQKDLIEFDEVLDKRWYDFLPRVGGIPYCSERLINILEENNITGFRKNLITLKNPPANYPGNYYWIEILGRCNITYKQFLKKKKIEYWDGSDIFLFEDGTTLTLVSEKLKNIITDKKLKITNVLLEDLDEKIEGWIETDKREKRMFPFLFK